MFCPKISIIIPVFNGSNYIAEAIESALSQTYKNFEIIVINDGSQDAGATEQAVAKYREQIRYYHKENGGVASALNFAIKQMQGDYFSWLSHDDLYMPEKLEKQIAMLRQLENKEVVLYSDYGVFRNTSDPTTPVRLPGVPAEHFRYWITVENSLHGCTLLIPKSAFSFVGNFDENLRTTQDYDLWFRMAKIYPFIHIPHVLVKARNHSEQNTHQMKPIVLDECNALLTNFVQSLSADEIKVATGKSLVASYRCIVTSFEYRGYREAAKAARDMLSKCSKKTFYGAPLMILNKYIYFLKRLQAKLDFQYIKNKIKSLLTVNSTYELAPIYNDLKNKFDEVYEKNLFRGKESRSGEGSNLAHTEVIRKKIPHLLKELNIKTMIDAPCGDWYWMSKTTLPVDNYIGIDIVEALITRNQANFGSDQVRFLALDITKSPLPYADLIFSRDCLVHLSYRDAIKAINNFKKSGAKYLLTTTFTERKKNEDLGSGFWRPLNKQLSPFCFPEPLLIINENCTEENNQYSDKSLGLWLLQDIYCEEV